MGPFTKKFCSAYRKSNRPPGFAELVAELAQAWIEVYAAAFNSEIATVKASEITEGFSQAMPDCWHVNRQCRADSRSYFLKAARTYDVWFHPTETTKLKD